MAGKLTIIVAHHEYDTPEEERNAHILSSAQLKFIRNSLHAAVLERLNLVPDPNNYATFIQQEAGLKGQIQAYRYILDMHNFEIERINIERLPTE